MKRVATALVFLLLAAAAFAARTPSPSPMPQIRTPQEQAMDFYGNGSRRLDKIAKMAEELKAKPGDAKLEQRINKELERAASDFKRAVSYDPNLYAAHSELGFALRKLGKYDESLASYDRALEIQPGFAPAIEYRAEAYLGLNRLDDAKAAYTVLFSGDRQRADLLLDAMKNWVDSRKVNAAGANADDIENFAKWVEQRQTIHRQTGSLTAPSSTVRSW